MIRSLSTVQERYEDVVPAVSACAHRTVAKEGRIVCARIVEGDNAVTPDVCRDCPVKAVNCSHLSFSLRQVSPTPLVVRFNGRTEVWDDDPPHVCFERAACAARVLPIENSRTCIGCTLRHPVDSFSELPAPRRRRAAVAAKVVPFPGRNRHAAAD